jgi:hypothetical protein
VRFRYLRTLFASLLREVRVRDLGISHALPFWSFGGVPTLFEVSELVPDFGLLVEHWIGFVTGNPRVGISDTAPMTPDTAPATGTV